VIIQRNNKNEQIQNERKETHNKIQTQFHKSWDTVQIVNKNRMQ